MNTTSLVFPTLSTVTTVYLFSSTEVVMVLISSVLMGTCLTTSMIAGLTVGTTFSMLSIVLEVTILKPSSVTVCSRTYGF